MHGLKELIIGAQRQAVPHNRATRLKTSFTCLSIRRRNEKVVF